MTERTLEYPTDDLPANSRVIRVIRPTSIFAPEGETSARPKSPEFSDSAVDGAMSVFLEADILAESRRVEELLTLLVANGSRQMFQPGSRLSWLPISYYREHGQAVTRREIAEFPGHANVRDATGTRSAKRKTNMAKASSWL